MSTRSTGIARERKLRERLELDGWWTCRAAGSLGDADVIALKQGHEPRLIEVKSTERGPFHSFGPADREALRLAAAKSGAVAWLVWWPCRKEPEWIPEWAWPGAREAA
jgi:Holliday junction resolvase